MSTATEIKIEPKVEPLTFDIRPEVDEMYPLKAEMENLKVETGISGLTPVSEENKNDENVLEKQKRTILTMDKKVEIIEYKELHPMETNAYIGKFRH